MLIFAQFVHMSTHGTVRQGRYFQVWNTLFPPSAGRFSIKWKMHSQQTVQDGKEKQRHVAHSQKKISFLTSSDHIRTFYLDFHNIYYLVTKVISSESPQDVGIREPRTHLLPQTHRTCTCIQSKSSQRRTEGRLNSFYTKNNRGYTQRRVGSTETQ